MTANDLMFEPELRVPQGGNETQIAYAMHKNIRITERTYIPWNIFKNIKVHYIVDLVLPMNTKVKGGEMSDVYYTEEGYGLPVFAELDDAFEFVDNFKS